MKTYLLLFLLFFSSAGLAQDLTGIWRGSFVSGDKRLNDMFNLEDRYKYEVQIDNRGKAFKGVTYSYKTTVFYGKASAKGTVNDKTGKVILEELQLLELKMAPGSDACWMICFLQYTKNGEEEFLEGKYSSYRETDSSFCGRGTVYLRKVPVSDFYKEPFLVKREKEKALELQKQKELAKANAKKSPVKPPVGPPLVKKTKPAPPKTTPIKKTVDPKSTTVTAKVDNDKKAPAIKNSKTVIIPPILKQRQNEVVQTINVQTDEITVDIYDNGTIDHDTVSVYLDKKLVLSKQMLKAVPLSLKIKMENVDDYHELVMVAENLGEIPPNTSLMVVRAGDKRYEVRITSTEQKNAMVIFKYQKPKLPVP